VLSGAEKLLERIARNGLFEALTSGVFAATRRPREEGRGYDGVVARSADYENPFDEALAALSRQAWAASPRPACRFTSVSKNVSHLLNEFGRDR